MLDRICGLVASAAMFCLATTFAFAARAQAPADAPLVRAGATVKVSPHVYVIPDALVQMVPNVGIIVGANATLVVDPGMGQRSGEVVLREVQKVTRGGDLYIANTHFHPEHTTGEAAFPASARIVRARAQQQDVDEMGMQWVARFASRSPALSETLKDITAFRAPAETFEREKVIDLGGVRVRLVWLGPGHTRGDTIVFVEEDRVLFSGDLAMKGLFPAFATPQSSGRSWLASLDALDALRPAQLVPAHGPLTDASTIAAYRAYLQALQVRVTELKRQKKSAEEASDILRGEFRAKYPDWAQPIRILGAVNAIYAEQ